jgi:beta-mannosidase
MEEKEYPYETKAQLCVTNDTLSEIKGTVFWALRDNTGAIVKEGSEDISVPALSVLWLSETDFEKTDVEHNYFSYSLKVKGEEISCGTALFTAPKHFEFSDPHLRCELCGDEITVYADAFARCVEIDSPDSDFILSDNYFDMNAGQKTVKILSGVPKTIKLRSVYDIR